MKKFWILFIAFLGIIFLLPQISHARIDEGFSIQIAGFVDSIPIVLHQKDRLLGNDRCAWGSKDCQACVYNVPDSFANISNNNGDHTAHSYLWLYANHGADELMGERTPSPSYSIDAKYHIQGVNRLAGPHSNQFVFTRNVFSNPGAFFVGILGDLPTHGSHLGTPGLVHFADGLSLDREVTGYFPIDYFIDEERYYQSHFSGSSLTGSYFFTPAECFPHNDYCDWKTVAMHIYDLADPLNPQLAGLIDLDFVIDNAGLVASTKLFNGNHLFVVGTSGAGTLHFFISDKQKISLDTNWHLRDSWDIRSASATDLPFPVWPGGYQNMSMVTECGSQELYLVMTARHSGEDWMDLYKLEENDHSKAVLRHVDEKHMYCGGFCNFKASGNIYVTPNHQMVLYSTTHAPGIGGLLQDNILMEEFQNQNE